MDEQDGWPFPPLPGDRSRRTRVTDIDGHEYVDFCLGDTGAMAGHSPAAVAEAVLDSTAVQVVGVIDAMAMGGQAMALLGIVVDGDPRTVADEPARRDEVVYSVLTSGGFDLLAEVVAPGPRDLLDFVNDVVRPIEGIRRIQSFPYFGIHTHRFLRDVG